MAIAPLVALAPDAIRAHASPQTQEVVLRFRGLPFARWAEGRITFGMDGHWEELNAKQRSSAEAIGAEPTEFPPSSGQRHAPPTLSRASRTMDADHGDGRRQSNRPGPGPRACVRAGVCANGRPARILDLLCVTRAHRLAILELKAVENPDLPLQAGDYWSRICRLQAQGDLARYGYFPGVELHSDPPVVYLVAPALRFHPSTDVLLRYLRPEMEIIRVGLVESWRRGLRVVMRQ